jgi:Cu(I)/Ag(I) efflux system periplasmic protein CusF
MHTPPRKENTMTKRTTLPLAVALLAAVVTPLVLAQGAAPGVQVAQASGDLVDAEVRKVDRDRSRVTLKHGEFKHLDMPPMTMVFNVANKTMMDKLTEGARVKVRVAQIDGKYTVTEVQAAP